MKGQLFTRRTVPLGTSGSQLSDLLAAAAPNQPKIDYRQSDKHHRPNDQD
jgi:hypothetical protein